MASLAMASLLHIPMSSASINGPRSIFSVTSSVRMGSTTSFLAPLRVSRVSQTLYWVARASPQARPQGTQNTNLEETVQHAIEETEEICIAEEMTPNCAEAWDEVEELASTLAHKKVLDKDLLESASKKVPLESSPKGSPKGSQSTILNETVRHAIEEAEEICASEDTSPECAEAWDEVEELASTVAHKKLSDKEDPLDSIRS